jgi:ribosomal protein S18 acetylase RimI-like enzyme
MFLFSLLTVALAAPVPKNVSAPITAANAAELQVVKEAEVRAYKLFHGPGAGELTVMDYGRTLQVIDDRDLKPVKAALPDVKPTSYAASADGKHRVWFERRTTKFVLEDVTAKKKTDIEVGDLGGGAGFSPDGKLLVVGYTVLGPNDPEGGGYSEARVIEVATGKVLHTLERTKQGGYTMAFSPDGKTLAVGNRNYETRLFDVKTGKLLHTLPRKMTHGIAFSPDGKALAAAYVDGSLGVWDVATGEQLGLAKSGCEELYSVAWGKTGDVLATSGLRGKVVLWEPKGLTKLKELDAGLWVIQVMFTADGSRLLAASAADHAATRERKITAFGLGRGGKPAPLAWRCDVEFRVLGPDDLAHMYSMLSLFGRAFDDADTYTSSPPDAGYLAGLLGSPGFIAVAALDGDRVAGGLAAYVLTKFEQARSEVYIYDLAVDEPDRRQGVATGLVDTVRAVAAARGAWVVYVQADRDDAPAIALYSKLGVREEVFHFDIPPHLDTVARDEDGRLPFTGPSRHPTGS